MDNRITGKRDWFDPIGRGDLIVTWCGMNNVGMVYTAWKSVGNW